MALKYAVLSMKNAMKSTSFVGMWVLSLVLSLVPKSPIFIILYFSSLAVVIECSTHYKTPYRFILPMSINDAVTGRLIYYLFTIICQVLLFIIFSLTHIEHMGSEIMIIAIVIINCFSFIMGFFYTKKRQMVALIMIGVFYAAITNIALIAGLAGGLHFGFIPTMLICLAILAVSYFVSFKIAHYQYVQ